MKRSCRRRWKFSAAKPPSRSQRAIESKVNAEKFRVPSSEFRVKSEEQRAKGEGQNARSQVGTEAKTKVLRPKAKVVGQEGWVRFWSRMEFYPKNKFRNCSRFARSTSSTICFCGMKVNSSLAATIRCRRISRAYRSRPTASSWKESIARTR